MSQNQFSLEGRVIIVTGAAGNLGVGYVESLVNAGAYVYAWDKEGEKLAQAFPTTSERITSQTLDLTNESEVVTAVASILKTHGKIDGLLNNAALNPAVGAEDTAGLFAPYEQYSIDLFRREMEANVVSMMITMKAVAPSMIKEGCGSIVNVASEVAVAAHDHRVYQTPGKYKSPAYSASKTAVIGLTRQWAARLGEHNVRVNAVSIGGVKTPNIPEDFAERFGAMNMLGRMAHPGEYNATMQYLLSDASSFLTAANIVIDGGKTAW
jgi:NAD(P)-dependent dehydrogenase (short-subunit alcohol dehydrogenase family)